jgi:hypothetical protein
MDEIATKQNDKIDKMGDKLTETRNWIMGVCLTTILAIAEMVLSLLYKS